MLEMTLLPLPCADIVPEAAISARTIPFRCGMRQAGYAKAVAEKSLDRSSTSSIFAG
jgi:hypothetical protein